MVLSIACLLTETGDAVSSHDVARCVFSMMFHDKILLCIYIINFGTNVLLMMIKEEIQQGEIVLQL